MYLIFPFIGTHTSGMCSNINVYRVQLAISIHFYPTEAILQRVCWGYPRMSVNNNDIL